MFIYEKQGVDVMADIVSLIVTYLGVVLGVIISVILPILRKMLPKPPEKARPKFWETARPYFILGVFSLVVGFLIVASLGDNLTDWRVSLLLGYAWDSSLQKLDSDNSITRPIVNRIPKVEANDNMQK